MNPPRAPVPAAAVAAHPRAGAAMNGADMIVQVLADEGVDTIFGYSGGAILPTYDAVFRYNEGRAGKDEIRLIVPATEQGAGFMAAGFARSSGRVGVSLVTSGPGATNSVTPVRDCQADSVPIVLICGQVPRVAMGTDAFQEAPVFNIMAACAKHVFLVTDETKVEQTLRTAFHIARSGRPGPVVVDIPRDVQLAKGTFHGSGLLHMRGYRDRLEALERATISSADGEAFFRLLGASDRPLIYAGGGFKKDSSRWRAHVTELRLRHPLNYNRGSSLIQVEYVLATLNQITRGNAIVSTGVGQHQMWAAQYLDFHAPRSFLTSGSMGTMGFGLPAAIGAQLANPGKLVIDVDGDGSIRMNLGELETLTTYDIPVKVLLLNNLGDGMVRQWQALFYSKRYSGSDKTLHKKDFVKAVEADGFQFARRVSEIPEVRPALEEFVRFPGPAFLEVMIDQTAHVYPMVAPGMGYKDMITGKWIKSREQKPPSDEEPSGYF